MIFINSDMKSFVYQESTISFVTAAAQTCLLLEQCNNHTKEEWIEQILRLLPVLYLRTRLVEIEELVSDEEPQRFVTEQDYNYTLIGIRNLLGSDDAYLDVFEKHMDKQGRVIRLYTIESIDQKAIDICNNIELKYAY